jgi:hypothetical protein
VVFNFVTLVYFDPAYLKDDDGAGPPHWVYFTSVAFFFRSFQKENVALMKGDVDGLLGCSCTRASMLLMGERG